MKVYIAKIEGYLTARGNDAKVFGFVNEFGELAACPKDGDDPYTPCGKTKVLKQIAKSGATFRWVKPKPFVKVIRRQEMKNHCLEEFAG